MTSITNYSLSKRGEKEDFILFLGVGGGFSSSEMLASDVVGVLLLVGVRSDGRWKIISRHARSIFFKQNVILAASRKNLLTTLSIRRSRERAPSALIE